MKISLSVAMLALALVLIAPAARAADVTADDTARFLAGLRPSAGSPLLPMTTDPAWQRHAQFFDAAFAELEQQQLSKVRDWSAANLAAPKSTMFYMFAGPDFLYANAFHFRATTYVLSGLEPTGGVSDLTALQPEAVAVALDNIERSLWSLLNFSFFNTRQMKADLDVSEVNGTLPILYVFLARSGMTIRDVKPVTLDGNGALYVGVDVLARSNARGTRIVFAGADGVEKMLYYFSTDLSNSGLKTSGFLKFCATLAPGDSLIKSASYLMHLRDFSAVRNFILANSATIVQDDSGIPLAQYDPRKWRFFPFGRYLGPIERLFPGLYQPSYAELFARARPIDFGIGYRWRPNESNVLLSVRLPSERTAAAEAGPSSATQPERTRPRKPRAPSPPSGSWR
ncbi:hypothetical protein [Bradyrhizobium sp. RD5-C2]|uniref:hypothetical protein n=1 Tax=Bradyrhizobium sp. RD5-C2 TaxID=244562 RepID=UPI001CC80604|nr:hypothetical protein [Bradyrhizobium sp. RD5-C2]GIQ78673.1 hypothetical protein BraRD5C2_71240 [Bradyrhizobium sp. RD5-C2]